MWSEYLRQMRNQNQYKYLFQNIHTNKVDKSVDKLVDKSVDKLVEKLE